MAWAVPAYTEWINKNPDRVATVDRRENTRHYTVENLRIVSREENNLNRESARGANAPPGTAWCGGTCKRYLSVENFSKNRTEENGLQAVCKACFSVLRRNWRAKKKQEMLQNE